MAVEQIEEIPEKELQVEEGHFENLTDEQHAALVKAWEGYFDICDRAKGTATKGEGFKAESEGDAKKAGIPSTDAGKDEAKKAQEMQGMNTLLQKYGGDALRTSYWGLIRGDSPDNTLLRFVRARKQDVGRAIAMLGTTLLWRLDSDVEGLIANGDLGNGASIEKFSDQQSSKKVFAQGTTINGQPCCYVVMSRHSLWGQPALSMQKFIVTQMESFRLFLHPPVDKATIVFDLKGFGVKQMDITNLLFLVKALESYYPETLGTMYVSQAPFIFSAFWNSVKGWIDPVVAKKIKFIKGPKDTDGDLPEDSMIEHCNGKNKTTFEYFPPKEGENDAQKDTARKEKLLHRHNALTEAFEKLTRAWCKTGGKDLALTEERRLVQLKLRLSHFELEPVTRGRSVYVRAGTLLTDHEGIAIFDYNTGNGPVKRQVLGKRTCQKSTELQLYDILKNGMTVQQAQEATAKSIKDGSWGQWKVNDNSDEIKKVATDSLDDLESHDPEKVAAKTAAA